MESGGVDWEEQKQLITELQEGRELAKQLLMHLEPSSSIELLESLAQKIFSSFNNALLLLKWNGSEGEQPTAAPNAAGIDSPSSASGSPRSENSGKRSYRAFKDQERRDISKKRKALPKWTEQVHVSSETGLEGPLEDGYSWRKYGQKDILGAKYPRGYYRCTHRNGQGCLATKQVQRSDTNPSVFDVTYWGTHTCRQTSQLIPETKLPQNYQQQQPQQQQQYLLNFKTGLKVKTEDLDKPVLTSSSFCFPSTSTRKQENRIFSPTGLENHLMGGFCSQFISPTTSESNYFSLSPCGVNCYGGGATLQNSETDFTEIISAATSATNSPMLDLDLVLDPVEFDQDFPFDAPGFFL